MKLFLEHFPNLNNKQIEQFSMLKAIYKNWNQKINVISRKDIDNINLRHVLHSMSIAKFIKFKSSISSSLLANIYVNTFCCHFIFLLFSIILYSPLDTQNWYIPLKLLGCFSSTFSPFCKFIWFLSSYKLYL